MRGKARGDSAREQHPARETLAAAARMRLALVVAAQIDDRFDSQRVDGRQIVDVSLDMMRRAPQDSVAPPSAAFDIITAIVAERSEGHTSEIQSLMRNSYADFSLIK